MTFTNIAILGGGGLMGHGIALACLQGSDARVTLVSRKTETLERGRDLVEDGPFGLAKAVARGKLMQDAADAMLARLDGTTDYGDGLARADLIFESIPEDLALKHEALRELEAAASPEAVIATNTSAIQIAELAAVLKHPSRLIGTHWFYPSNVMPLVEVARGTETAPDVADRLTAFLAAIGKKPVTVNDGPGFFMTRFINTYLAEAIRLVEEGIAGPAEIDEMVKTGLGWPMGVFELLDDAAAFDAFHHAQTYLATRLGERYAVPPLAAQAFEAGYLGNPGLKPGSKGGLADYLAARKD